MGLKQVVSYAQYFKYVSGENTLKPYQRLSRELFRFCNVITGSRFNSYSRKTIFMPNPGYWGFPGGHLESFDSSREEGAIREFIEELNLFNILGLETSDFHENEFELVYSALWGGYYFSYDIDNHSGLSEKLKDSNINLLNRAIGTYETTPVFKSDVKDYPEIHQFKWVNDLNIENYCSSPKEKTWREGQIVFWVNEYGKLYKNISSKKKWKVKNNILDSIVINYCNINEFPDSNLEAAKKMKENKLAYDHHRSVMRFHFSTFGDDVFESQIPRSTSRSYSDKYI